MSELHDRVAHAREHLVSRWSARREADAWTGIERRQHTASQTRWLAATASALVLLVLLLVWRTRPSTELVAPAPLPPPSAAEKDQGPGFRMTALTAETRVTELERSPSVVRLRLEQGSATFDVTPSRYKDFEILAGEARARVLGTVFTVELHPETVSVAVERGRVRLDWPGGFVELGAGEKHVVPRRGQESHHARPRGSDEPARPAPPKPPDWRELAARGAYHEAYAALAAGGASAVRHEPGDLLLAADVARLGGHPSEAVPRLETVVASYGGDSRAPLAAFTLGRVLLDQLGRPARAADAFARARRMAPGGALAEDALAREIEARARAGDQANARRLADEYLARYPAGRRAAAVRRHVGLD